MNSPHFASILDEAPTEVKSPPPIPVGTYLCVVGQPEDTVSSEKKTPGIKFPLRPIAPLDDVDNDALNEMGGIEGKSLNITFWTTPDSIFMLDQFHEHCGIDLSEPASRRVRNQEVVNVQVLAVVAHRPDRNNANRVFAEVRRTAAAE